MPILARISLFVALWALWISPARSDFFVHHWENHPSEKKGLHTGMDLFYYTSQSNFDPSGERVIPLNLQRYSRIESDINLRYSLTDQLSLYGRFGWTRVQVDHDTRGGETFGLTDQTFGANFRAFKKNQGPFVDLQLQGDFPAYNNPASQSGGTPFLGDGSIDLSGGVFFTLPFNQRPAGFFAIVAGTGLTYRTAGFSSAIPWSTRLSYSAAEDGIIADVFSAGFFSLNTDSSGNPRSTSTLSQGTGGLFITNAINPSLLTLGGKLGYQFARNLRVSAQLSQAVWGRSAPSGFLVGASIDFQWGDQRQKNNLELTPKEYGRANQGLISYDSFEASILRSNDRLNLIMIDHGTTDGVEMGQIFDVFTRKADGSPGDVVARGKVSGVKSSEAILTITEYFKEVWINEGFAARRVIQ